jgi:hypothetical protein
MFTVIMMVAIVTSLVAPPLLGWSLRGIPERPSDAERTDLERILGKLPFIREGAKLLVLDAGGPHVQMATHLAAPLSAIIMKLASQFFRQALRPSQKSSSRN